MSARLLLLLPICAALMPGSARAASVRVDAATHTVEFTATATDCGLDAQLEFLFVGPDSDRAYEALFVTDARVEEIADAFQAAGIPQGVCVDASRCKLWPVGEELALEPKLDQLVRDTSGNAIPSVIYTGGARDVRGKCLAETNMPSAVFAFYDCGQSLLQLNGSFEQSATYGRFMPKEKYPVGQRMSFKFTWSGKPDFVERQVRVRSGRLAEAVRELKGVAESNRVVTVSAAFDASLTLKEAKSAAQAFALIDSPKVRFNGFTPGEFFYRAYLPLEKWRDRAERLCQPPEAHLKRDGSVVVVAIAEDWSGEGTTPKLDVTETDFPDVLTAAAKLEQLIGLTDTVLVYAPSDITLDRLFSLRKALKRPVTNWYIFSE